MFSSIPIFVPLPSCSLKSIYWLIFFNHCFVIFRQLQSRKDRQLTAALRPAGSHSLQATRQRVFSSFAPSCLKIRAWAPHFCSFYFCLESRKAKDSWAEGKYRTSSPREVQGRGLQLSAMGLPTFSTQRFGWRLVCDLDLQSWKLLGPVPCLPQLAATKKTNKQTLTKTEGSQKLFSTLGKIKVILMLSEKKLTQLFEYIFRCDLNKCIELI